MTLPQRRPGCRAALRQAGSFACLIIVLSTGALVVATSVVKALPGDLEMIANTSDLDSDARDFQAVAEVCTRCHNATQFLTTPRSDGRWEQVFSEMSDRGATGTDDQLNRVVSYFQKNLTVINVNTSPAEELGPTLQISDAVAAAIVARRADKKFSGIDDLSAVPGVERSILEKLRAKGCLQF